jgi:hypothetical protein
MIEYGSKKVVAGCTPTRGGGEKFEATARGSEGDRSRVRAPSNSPSKRPALTPA